MGNIFTSMRWELKVSAFSLTEHLNELTVPKGWQSVTIIFKDKYINNMPIGVALPL